MCAAEPSNLSSGYALTCSVASDGTVACWGDNFYGQLGNGSTTTALVPVSVMLAIMVPLLPASRLGLGVLLALLGGFLSTG